jgi:hypothetical protein
MHRYAEQKPQSQNLIALAVITAFFEREDRHSEKVPIFLPGRDAATCPTKLFFQDHVARV